MPHICLAISEKVGSNLPPCWLFAQHEWMQGGSLHTPIHTYYTPYYTHMHIYMFTYKSTGIHAVVGQSGVKRMNKLMLTLTGYVLTWFLGKPEQFASFSHIIIDEVTSFPPRLRSVGSISERWFVSRPANCVWISFGFKRDTSAVGMLEPTSWMAETTCEGRPACLRPLTRVDGSLSFRCTSAGPTWSYSFCSPSC